jgi:hypothetical protein
VENRGKVVTAISELVHHAGPGILNDLRIDFGGEADQAPLRIMVDGVPAVDMRVSEFWGFSRRLRPQAKFQSLLLGVGEDGVYYCRFPMPFRKELRIETSKGARITARLAGGCRKRAFLFSRQPITDRLRRDATSAFWRRPAEGTLWAPSSRWPIRPLEGDDRFSRR